MVQFKFSGSTANKNKKKDDTKNEKTQKQQKSTENKGKEQGKFVELPGAEMGKVVVRFPPEASGLVFLLYLSIFLAIYESN